MVDVAKGSADALVLRNEVPTRFAIMTCLSSEVLWKRVLITSKGCRIFVTKVEQADATPHNTEYRGSGCLAYYINLGVKKYLNVHD